MNKKKEKFNMLDECINKYSIQEYENDEFEITIRAPKKFQNIWLVKINGLTTSVGEIEKWKEK